MRGRDAAYWAGPGHRANQNGDQIKQGTPHVGILVDCVTDFATVDGYAPFTPENNDTAAWCENGLKIEDNALLEPYFWTVSSDHPLVVVKAGSSGEFANTIFEDVAAGEAVWADTNGNGLFDPGGQGGDKEVSHVILCLVPEPTPTPTPSESATPTPASTPTTPAPPQTPVASPGSVSSPQPIGQTQTLPQTGMDSVLGFLLLCALAFFATGWITKRWSKR